MSENNMVAANDRRFTLRKILMDFMSTGVLVLSILLIVYISILTFRNEQLLANHQYMTFQFWVCIFFLCDFIVRLVFSANRLRYLARNWAFLLLSIPYLNIVNYLDISVGQEAMFFLRFIPLMRGALAMGIVIGYLSTNAITSLFISYITIMLLVTYFCSLIFYQREHGINHEVDTYWTALWWAFMNMSTVGCYINPMTVTGKLIAVVLPIFGMIIFPLFTVYLTNYVTQATNHAVEIADKRDDGSKTADKKANSASQH